MKPNILLITADHLRYDTLGCNGNPVIQTPGIDELSAASTRFDHYYVQNPVCQPSRASLLTGRYPRHHGVRWNGSRLSENEITMTEFFKRHGYATACIGKHHVEQKRFRESLDHMEAHAIRRNWEERADGDYTVHAPNPFEQYVRDRGYEYRTGYALPDFRRKLGAVPSDLPEDCHLDAYVGMRCVEYLNHVPDSKPFLLWMGFYGPHHPYVPSGRFARMYAPGQMPGFALAEDDLDRKPPEYRVYCSLENHKYRGFAQASEQTYREMKAAYYGMVSQLDAQVGVVLDLLARRGLADNTIVVFTSDHGEFLGDHGIPAKAPFLLDCMLHVPCFIRVPGRTSGTRTDEFVEEIDVFPTLAALAGCAHPEWTQGRNLAALANGGGIPADSRRDAVYAEAVDKKSIRTRRWKYIHYPGRHDGELYRVDEDPDELHNCYQDEPRVVERLRLQLYELLDATADLRHPSYMRFTGRLPGSDTDLTHYHTW